MYRKFLSEYKRNRTYSACSDGSGWDFPNENLYSIFLISVCGLWSFEGFQRSGNLSENIELHA